MQIDQNGKNNHSFCLIMPYNSHTVAQAPNNISLILHLNVFINVFTGADILFSVFK